MSGYYEGSWNWIVTFRDPVTYTVFDVNGPGGYPNMDEAKEALAEMIWSGELFKQTRVKKDWLELGADLLWTNNYRR